MDLTNEIVIRKATLSDAEEIHSIMLYTYEHLEDKSLFICDDLDYVKKCLNETGFAVVACNSCGKIIASFIFEVPGDSSHSYGKDIGLPESKLEQIIHMLSVVVLPEYRGNHLQERLLKYGESLINTTQYNIFMATVSPDNPASYKTFEKLGYKNVLTKEKYGGFKRRIYMKTIKE